MMTLSPVSLPTQVPIFFQPTRNINLFLEKKMPKNRRFPDFDAIFCVTYNSFLFDLPTLMFLGINRSHTLLSCWPYYLGLGCNYSKETLSEQYIFPKTLSFFSANIVLNIAAEITLCTLGNHEGIISALKLN